MRYAIAGNNDGPLRLLKSLKDQNLPLPAFLGLQKTPEPELLKQYKDSIDGIPFAIGFEERELIELLEPHNPETLINCFCNFKFAELLKRYTCYNIHPSYLPAYRGRHPMHWALINGEKTYGISLHKMTESYDDGGIVWQQNIPIYESMSVAQLREALMQVLEKGFPEALRSILENDINLKENPSDKGNYIPRRSPEDSQLLEWNDPSRIYRKIKTLRSEAHPAFLLLRSGEKLPIIDVERIADQRAEQEEAHYPFAIAIERNLIVVKVDANNTLGLYFKPDQASPKPENILFHEQ